MTPKQVLKSYLPAFRDLFSAAEPDLNRFLRLVIDVLDPAAGYGPSRCSGDGTLLPSGCGKLVIFQQAVKNDHAYGYCCPNCGAVYPFAFCKGPKKAPQTVTLCSEGGSTIGSVRSKSESGVTIIDDGTCWTPFDGPQTKPE